MWLNSTLVFLGGMGLRSGTMGEMVYGGTLRFFEGSENCKWSRASIQVAAIDREIDALSRPFHAESLVFFSVDRNERSTGSPFVKEGSRVHSRNNDCPLDRRATVLRILTGKWERP